MSMQLGLGMKYIYSTVPNRRVGQNKRAGGKILKKNKRADPNKAVQGGFVFLKINKRAGQIPIHMPENKLAWGLFFSKTINVQS